MTDHAAPITIVPSFHYDVAYLKTHAAYMPRSFAILDAALELLERCPDYHFLVEQVILLEAYWKARPERREAMKALATEGRLSVGPGMYVMPDLNHCDGESLFRQAELGFRWLKEHLGIQPSVCWIADCWGHHAQLPQILSACGYGTYVFWRCMRPELMQRFFRWQGLDGTQLPTHWLARGYTNLHFGATADAANVLDQEFANAGRREIEALCDTLRGYGGGGHMLICNGGDFVMPQEIAVRCVRQLNASGAEPRLQFVSPDACFERVDWSAMPLVEGEFNSALQGTFTSNIRIKQRNRQLVQRLLALETLAAVSAGEAADFETIWRLLLKQQFHDIICGTICDEALADALRDYDEAEALLTTAARMLGGGDGWYNPLSFARTERVELESGPAIVTVDGFSVVREVTPLPPAEPVQLPADFSNRWYRARIGADGYLASLRLTDGERELIDADHRSPFGALGMQLDYGDLWLNFEAPLNGGSLASSLTQNHADPFDRATPDSIVNRGTMPASVREISAWRRGDDALEVRQRGSLSFWQLQVEFETTIRLDAGSPHIHYRTTFTPAGRHYRLRAAFPTTLQAGRSLHEIPFGIQERGDGEHCAQHWVARVGEAEGVTLLNRGMPGASVDKGTLLLTLFRSAAMEYKAPSAASFGEGIPHVFDYAVMPHAADALSDVVRQGLAFNRPLVPAPVGAVASWRLSGDPGVILVALRRIGEDVIVRLYESVGVASTARLEIPSTYGAMAEADGLGQARGEARALAASVELQFQPFQIRTLRLFQVT